MNLHSVVSIMAYFLCLLSSLTLDSRFLCSTRYTVLSRTVMAINLDVCPILSFFLFFSVCGCRHIIGYCSHASFGFDFEIELP